MTSRTAIAHRIDATVLGTEQGLLRRLVIPAVAWTAVIAWGVGTIGAAAGMISSLTRYSDWMIPAGPLVLMLLVLLSRPHSPGWLKVAFGWALTTAAALESLILVGDNWLIVGAPVVAIVAMHAVRRWPVPAVLLLFALAASYGSLEAFTPLSAGQATDALLAGGWLTLAWGWLTGQREQPGWIPLPFAMLGAYVAVTALFVPFGESLEQSGYSFRASAWLMLSALMVAYLLPEARRQDLVFKGFLVISALAGGYAMLRWIIGPAAKEEEIARQGGPYVLGDDNELRLIGSFPDPDTLGAFCLVLVPFTVAAALAPIGTRWRILALAAAGMLTAAIQGSDSRGAMVGAVLGTLVVLLLFAAGRGFAGRKALPLALGVILIVAGGGVFAATKLSADGQESFRFRGLYKPLEDLSVQDRLVKWETVLAGIDELPFGHGLGSSGAAEIKYARFSSPATFDPDSTFVKVAYDQGIMVLLLFIAALIALVAGLGQRAVRAPDARSSVLAVGACGALVSFCSALGSGVYFEGLQAAPVWLIVGLAMAPYVRELALRRTGNEG